MTPHNEQRPIALRLVRSKSHTGSVQIDDFLNLYPFECLKGGEYVVIDLRPETTSPGS